MIPSYSCSNPDLRKATKVSALVTSIDDNLDPIVEVVKKTLKSGDSKLMSNLTDLAVINKSIGLCY